MNNIDRALMVAKKVHAGQSYDIYPYIYHIIQVVTIAKELGYDESIQVACALHDSLEDGPLSFNDIKNNFGEEVAEIVFCVTDELGRDRKEKKEKTYPKIRNNWKAVVVKICDRIANVRQSKKYNPKLYKMYWTEHPDFVMGIFNDDHAKFGTAKAWELLTETIKEN